MTGWDDYLTKLRNGFQPPRGPGRCDRCGFHTPTQGHRPGCPDTRKPLHPQRLHNKPQRTHKGRRARA